MSKFLSDLVTRLFERETLVTIAVFVMVITGHVQDVPQAIAVLGTAGVLVGGRSAVKMAQAKSLLGEAQPIAATISNTVNATEAPKS